jgi:hypothetical protein
MQPGCADGPVHFDEFFHRPAWMERAACRGHPLELFFPAPGADTKEAHLICASCPVRTECLEYAVADSELAGIWGGTSARSRRQMRSEHMGRRQAKGDTEANPEGLLCHPSTRDGDDVAREKGAKVAFQIEGRLELVLDVLDDFHDGSCTKSSSIRLTSHLVKHSNRREVGHDVRCCSRSHAVFLSYCGDRGDWPLGQIC